MTNSTIENLNSTQIISQNQKLIPTSKTKFYEVDFQENPSVSYNEI